MEDERLRRPGDRGAPTAGRHMDQSRGRCAARSARSAAAAVAVTRSATRPSPRPLPVRDPVLDLGGHTLALALLAVELPSRSRFWRSLLRSRRTGSAKRCSPPRAGHSPFVRLTSRPPSRPLTRASDARPQCESVPFHATLPEFDRDAAGSAAWSRRQAADGADTKFASMAVHREGTMS